MNPKERKAARQARIASERREMRLKPWELCPSEVDDGPSPWPPGTGGYESWQIAQRQRAEILARDPTYFDRPPAED